MLTSLSTPGNFKNLIYFLYLKPDADQRKIHIITIIYLMSKKRFRDYRYYLNY
jgi:hypothetical protein